MNTISSYINEITDALGKRQSKNVANSIRRFFPDDFQALGVTNGDVQKIADEYLRLHPDLAPLQLMEMTERLLATARFHEEVMLGFALIRKTVRSAYGDLLMDRFPVWLKEHVTNWAQCDDLCLKVIHPYLVARPHLTTRLHSWVDSPSPWCRRASNVAQVKLVRLIYDPRSGGLTLEAVFHHCTRLLDDGDYYVQKSLGWLLKAVSQSFPEDVINFLEKHCHRMKRDTLRYATEKLNAQTKTHLRAAHPQHPNSRARA